MPSGRLASASLPAGNGAIYTCPVGNTATVNLLIAGTSENDGLVSVAITSSVSPAASEYLELDGFLAAFSRLELTGLVLSEGQAVHVTTTQGATVNVYGFLE